MIIKFRQSQGNNTPQRKQSSQYIHIEVKLSAELKSQNTSFFVYMDSLDDMYICASHTCRMPENKGASDLLEPEL